MKTIHMKMIVLLLTLMGLFTGCNGEVGLVETVRGSGNVVTEAREVRGFTAVSPPQPSPAAAT